MSHDDEKETTVMTTGGDRATVLPHWEKRRKDLPLSSPPSGSTYAATPTLTIPLPSDPLMCEEGREAKETEWVIKQRRFLLPSSPLLSFC